MKVLAIEKALSRDPIPKSVLKREAEAVLKHYQSGFIEQIWFNEQHDAVLLIHARDKGAAAEVLDTFPLVAEGYIRFSLMALSPYTGFSRLRG